MKARQKLMSLLGVTLLLASTILTPISTVVAQTQNSTQTSQTTSGSKEVSKEQALLILGISRNNLQKVQNHQNRTKQRKRVKRNQVLHREVKEHGEPLLLVRWM